MDFSNSQWKKALLGKLEEQYDFYVKLTVRSTIVQTKISLKN